LQAESPKFQKQKKWKTFREKVAKWQELDLTSQQFL
jgi:hypothetical protein